MTTPAPQAALMTAVFQDVLGGPEVLREVQIERPEPGPSQVLVRVKATSLSPTDWVHRQVPGFLGDGPKILGWDVSGIVEKVGLGVTIHRPGDEVFGMLPYPYGHGAAAEFVTAPARALVPRPIAVTHEQAAALPLVSLTAWQALVDTADVRPGQRVLVHGAAGGVGHVAVQIAVARGAIVVGTASAHNHDLVRTLGASEVIDYTTTDFAEAARDIDIVIDTVGHDYPQRSLLTMRAGGTVVSLALSSTQPLGAAAKVRGVRHELLLVESDHAGMHGIAELVSAGTLRPHIAATYPLRDAAVGHLQGETGHVAGKIVLTL